jgi:uncharacterized protein YydD (DUF2326 family)
MQLIKLSANQSSFKTVRFNDCGISLIIAEKENKDVQDKKRTNNGAGKSLLVEIIHFCLGSNRNNAFQESLPNWEFTLEFKINVNNFTSIRSTGKQDEIKLNTKSYRLGEFNDFLEQLTFDIPNSAKQLTFRVLYPRFMRRKKEDYNDATKTSADNEDFTALVRNLFLLGIDIDLPTNKYNLRSKEKKLDNLKESFKKDEFIKSFYIGEKDPELQATYLEEKIRFLNLNLSEFKVANDYYEIEKEADKINQDLGRAKNKKTIIENALYNIGKSIEVKPDVSKEKILSLYNELLSAFKTESLKKITEVEDFNSQLIKNRVSRLSQEKLKLLSELELMTTAIKELSSRLDEKMLYLSDKRALDQYVAVSNEKAVLLGKLQKIRDHQALVKKIEAELLDIQKRFAEESIKTSQYLAETKIEREEKFSLFSTLVKSVYPNAPAGISLKNNVGKNKIRYDFGIKIEADKSDGINSVKIFCYDLSVMLMGCNHHINFIWHDSRLFTNIDPRQRAILFKLAYEYCNKYKKQYIATVNQDEIEIMKAEFTEAEFNEIFYKNKVLTLKDDKDENKLLGIKVDMDY